MYDMSYGMCGGDNGGTGIGGSGMYPDQQFMCFSGPDGTQFANVNGNCYDIQQQVPHQQNMYFNGQIDYSDINSLEPSLIPTDQHQSMMMYGQHNTCQNTAQQHMQQNTYMPLHNSPTGSSSHTSTTSEENEEFMAWHHPYKRSPPEPIAEQEGRTVKRGKSTKKRKPKRDPNEPQKPVSAYALFFRDTQAAIKGQNPNASFGEVSKIVASMWDSLDPDAKNAYKQKTETAKKDYLKQLAAYRANLISRNGGMDPMDFGGGGTGKLASPDSTTHAGVMQHDSHAPPRDASVDALGEKSLASLIAEPPPQHVLTATTTLTVPQAYIPSRKCDVDEDHLSLTTLSNGCNTQWDRDFCPPEGLVQHCRDVFNIWGGPPRPQQTNPPSGYAPV